MDPINQQIPSQTVSQNQPVLQSTPVQTPQGSPVFMWLIVVLLVTLITVGAVAGYMYLIKHPIQITNQSTPQTQPTGIPHTTTTDLAPGVPNAEKTVILVQHSDSSQEKVIIKTDLAAGYIKALPEGEKVISESPAGK